MNRIEDFFAFNFTAMRGGKTIMKITAPQSSGKHMHHKIPKDPRSVSKL
jgi:hypothetical protein